MVKLAITAVRNITLLLLITSIWIFGAQPTSPSLPSEPTQTGFDHFANDSVDRRASGSVPGNRACVVSSRLGKMCFFAEIQSSWIQIEHKLDLGLKRGPGGQIERFPLRLRRLFRGIMFASNAATVRRTSNCAFHVLFCSPPLCVK